MNKLTAILAAGLAAVTFAAAGATSAAADSPATSRPTPPTADPCYTGQTTLHYLLPCTPDTPTMSQWCAQDYDHTYLGTDLCAPPQPKARRCRSTIGELQIGRTVVAVAPPCELDVFMFAGRYRNQSVAERCADMVGRLGSERFRGKRFPVCYDVEY